MSRSLPSCSCLLVFLTALPLQADVFVLKDGGRIEGTLLNADETPRKLYRIEAADGLEIALEPKFIDRARAGEREALREYNAFAPFWENTVENHLQIADWCSQNQLPDLAKRHRSQVLEIDPEHRQARQLLGFFKDTNGEWTTQNEQLGEKRGLVRKDGRWKSKQQIDVEQRLENQKKQEKSWADRVNALRTSLPRGEKARADILAIDDPSAIGALWNALNEEGNEDTRILLIKALSNIGTSRALHALAQWSLNGREYDELRKTCRDEIRRRPETKQALVAYYASYLYENAYPGLINAAALGIAELDGHSAIPQLIDALVTSHTKTVTKKAPGPSFGSMGNVQGTQFGWGQSTEKVTDVSQNQEVLAALRKLTGVDFGFNKDAWRNWLIQQRRTSAFNARRG